MVDTQILLLIAESVAAISLVLVLLFGEAFLTQRLTVPRISFEHNVGNSPYNLKMRSGGLSGYRPIIDSDDPVTIRYFAIGAWNRAKRFSKTAEDCEVFLKPLLQSYPVKHTAFWLNYADTELLTAKILEKADIRSIMDALREKVFATHATDLDPDDGHSVIVAFGVDTLKKVCLATDPPVELPPSGKTRNVLLFQIVINMKDFATVRF